MAAANAANEYEHGMNGQGPGRMWPIWMKWCVCVSYFSQSMLLDDRPFKGLV